MHQPKAMASEYYKVICAMKSPVIRVILLRECCSEKESLMQDVGRLPHLTNEHNILTIYKAIPGGHGGTPRGLNSAADDDEFL
jgi:hypothetical protein